MLEFLSVNITTKGTRYLGVIDGKEYHLSDIPEDQERTLVAYLRVSLKPDLKATAENFKSVINECMQIIGTPISNMIYEQKCTKGKLELMCSDTLFNTTESINQRIEIAFNNLRIE